jgi:hypothetical protein
MKQQRIDRNRQTSTRAAGGRPSRPPREAHCVIQQFCRPRPCRHMYSSGGYRSPVVLGHPPSRRLEERELVKCCRGDGNDGGGGKGGGGCGRCGGEIAVRMVARYWKGESKSLRYTPLVALVVVPSLVASFSAANSTSSSSLLTCSIVRSLAGMTGLTGSVGLVGRVG